MMERPHDVDLVVIGGGQGGVPLADTVAGQGKRVVLFEPGPFGGTCVNVGCTPSKTMLAAAHAAGRARQAAAIGVHAEVTVDQPAVFERVRRIRSAWSAATGQHLADAGVEVVRAAARFCGERTVTGGGRTVRGERVVIDTGGRARLPDIAGLAGTPFLTNENFFEQTTLPPRLIVLGGGYIGLELGQGAQRMGSAVTIVHNRERVLDREEPDASDFVNAGLEADGVRFVLSATTQSVAHDGARFSVRLADGTVLEAEGLLVAVGRAPAATDLDLDAGGIARTQRGFVQVDDFLEATAKGVFAIGDVAGQPGFTHVSWEDHRRLLATFAGAPRRRDDRVLSYTTFTEPQIARTGLTLDAARAQGLDARAETLSWSDIARATEWNLEKGFYRIVVERASGAILGATFAGYEAGELIHIVVAHIEAKAPWQTLARSMYVHPTLAEGLTELAQRLEKD